MRLYTVSSKILFLLPCFYTLHIPVYTFNFNIQRPPFYLSIFTQCMEMAVLYVHKYLYNIMLLVISFVICHDMTLDMRRVSHQVVYLISKDWSFSVDIFHIYNTDRSMLSLILWLCKELKWLLHDEHRIYYLTKNTK